MMLNLRNMLVRNNVVFADITNCRVCPMRGEEETYIRHYDSEGEELEDRFDSYHNFVCNLNKLIKFPSGIITDSPPEDCPMRKHVVVLSNPNIQSVDIKQVLRSFLQPDISQEKHQ